jgi:hypothetical protein
MSTLSPVSWPNSSFTALKWSMSKETKPSVLPLRRARESSALAASTKPRRLSRPVRPSTRASPAGRSTRRSLRAESQSLTPPTTVMVTITSSQGSM